LPSFSLLLIFIAIGPLIGSLSLWLGSNFSALSRGNVGIDQFFNGFLFVLVFGYFLGFAFALISGIVVAAAGLWMRWNNFLVPIIAVGDGNARGLCAVAGRHEHRHG
jgi:hypothetical protein